MVEAEVAAQLVGNIEKAWAEFLLADRRPSSNHTYIYASAWRECERRMALELTDSDKLPQWEPKTLANFRRGKDRERDVKADLSRVGRLADPPFELVGEEERFELRDRKGRVAIVGKVDARLQIGRSAYPIEIKSWNANMTARIRSFADCFDGKWTRSGAYQLLAYLFGANEPVGFLVLDRHGLPAILPVVLYEHLDRIDEFLGRAERVLDHIEAGTLPDFHEDPAVCKQCPFFGAVCNPPLSYPGARIILDDDLIGLLERREELKPYAKEFAAIDDSVKADLRGVESAIAGDFVVNGKWSASTSYDIPKEVKESFKRTDLRGRFTLTITKIGAQP